MKVDIDLTEEQKPHIDLNIVWNFRLGGRDSVLVLKALRGVLTDEEQDKCVEIANRLTELRAHQAAAFSAQMQKHLANMEKEKNR